MRFKSPIETVKIRASSGGYYPVSQSVYVATIDEYPELIKVGCSMYVEARMKQLSNYYKLTFRLHSFYADVFESDIHKMLAAYQYSGKFSEVRRTGKEIFNCSVEDAINAVKEINYRYKRVK